LKEVESWVKYFIWSRDISKRKMATVFWDKLCMPFSEGVLEIRSLTTLNEASNTKLCWDLKNSKEH